MTNQKANMTSQKASSTTTSAIVVSLLAIVVLMIAVGFKISPTGMATSGVGYATVDISGVNAIVVTDNHVNLSLHIDNVSANPGAYVASNASSAIINSFDNKSNENWLNVSDSAPRIVAPDNLSINNTGTIVANITLSSSVTPIAFFGASGGDMWFNITNATGGGCNQISAQGWTQYSTNSSIVCGKLSATDGSDTLNIWIRWQIPSGAAAGGYNNTITLTSTQAV